jgi:hypothetical protein
MYTSFTADVAVATVVGVDGAPERFDPRSMCFVGPLCEESS